MDMKIRVCVNHEGKTLIIPLMPKKKGKLMGFLRKYYLDELELDTKTVKEMFKNLDNIIFTKGNV